METWYQAGLRQTAEERQRLEQADHGKRARLEAANASTEIITQDELEQVRHAAVQLLALLGPLESKYHRTGLKVEPGPLMLYPQVSASIQLVPANLATGLAIFLDQVCIPRRPEPQYVPPRPKPDAEAEAEARYRKAISERLGISFEEVAALSPKELAERLSRVEVPVPHFRS
jgi:hypothetical protein